MHAVEVSYTVEPSYTEITRRLSPRDIVRYAEIYELESHEDVNGDVRILVSFEGDEMEFRFSEIDGGYEYTLLGGSGPFAERHTTIIVSAGDETEIHAKTRYSLDTRLSFILDRLAASTVRQELEATIENLVTEAMAGSDSE